MKRICAWCSSEMGETNTGEGITQGICDECLERLYNGEIAVGRGFLAGRCVHCNTRFIWNDPINPKRALCPKCGLPLKQTSRLFRGQTEPLVCPKIHGPGRIPVGIRQ
jgi:hypothetical protein